MIFCNGDMGSVNGLTAGQINGLRASGMTTMIIFNLGVAANGDFTYGTPICSNGVYVGPTNWGARKHCGLRRRVRNLPPAGW